MLAARASLVAGIAVLAALAVVRAPHGLLWKPAVAATEWGHVLAGVALALAVPWERGRPELSGALAVVAAASALALLSPALRALRVDPDPELARAFGRVPAGVRAPFGFGGLAGSGVRVGPVRTEVLSVDPPAGGEPERVRRIDLYGTGPGARRPLVLAIHGGSWTSGDRTQLPGLYHALAAEGWAVAAVEYRLAPAHRWPAQREDLLAALAWVRARADELGVDPDRVVLYGRSAGGHLALQLAHRDPPAGVVAVVALYPPTDLRWSWDHPTSPWILDTPGRLTDLLGGSPGAVPDAYVDASPIAAVRPGGVPTLLVHGGRDELVFPEQTERMAAALAAAGVPHVVLRLPWATHGCDANLAGPSGQLVRYTLERFLAGLPR